MKSVRLSALGLSLAFLLSPFCVAQEKNIKELTFQVPNMASMPTWRVTNADTSGEMTLKYEGFGDASMSAVEGYFFLIPVAKDAKGMVRVLVTDVDTKEITAKTSPEAAKIIGKGTAVRLVRPFPGVTKQLKAIPEFVAFAKDEPNKDDGLMAARDPANRVRSINNMKQIGLAMHNFFSANDVLPPAILRNPDGKPMVSWRVLILPYIEQQALFNQYDFAEPWDSEKNLKLLDQMPALYRDPVYGNDKDHFTNYAVLVGDKTLFPPKGVKMKELGKIELDPKMEGTVGLKDVRDGTSNTLCLVPVSPDRKIPWTKPEDIVFDDNFPPIGQPKGIAAPYELNGEKVAPVILMDGASRTLRAKIQKPALDALITKAGGEIIGQDVFDEGNPPEIQIGVATMTIRIVGDKATATTR